MLNENHPDYWEFLLSHPLSWSEQQAAHVYLQSLNVDLSGCDLSVRAFVWGDATRLTHYRLTGPAASRTALQAAHRQRQHQTGRFIPTVGISD